MSYFHLFSFVEKICTTLWMIQKITHLTKTQQSFRQSDQSLGWFRSSLALTVNCIFGKATVVSKAAATKVWHPWLYIWQLDLEYSRFGSVYSQPHVRISNPSKSIFSIVDGKKTETKRKTAVLWEIINPILSFHINVYCVSKTRCQGSFGWTFVRAALPKIFVTCQNKLN